MRRVSLLSACAAVSFVFASCSTAPARHARAPIVLDDDGSWCWFQEERALIRAGKLLVGSVSSGHQDPQRRGDVNLLVHDIETGTTRCVELHDRLQVDDHDAPGLEVLSDGRVIALYAGHGIDDLVCMRSFEEARDFGAWGPERAHEQRMEQASGVTYSNVFRLAAEGGPRGRLYDFYRGEGWDPNAITSDDDGESWSEPQRLLMGQGRPYVRYASNGRDRIDFICTDQHPRSADNSVYHGFLRGERIHRSRGLEIGTLGRVPVPPHALTQVFPADPARVFFSTDADPVSGAPLVSATDGERHYELFEGRTTDGGAAYLLWLRGTYRTYQDFAQEVVALRL
jgi:hypothetical protein